MYRSISAEASSLESVRRSTTRALVASRTGGVHRVCPSLDARAARRVAAGTSLPKIRQEKFLRCMMVVCLLATVPIGTLLKRYKVHYAIQSVSKSTFVILMAEIWSMRKKHGSKGLS